MSFHVGQKICCVKNGSIVASERKWESQWLREGSIYTIRWIGENPYELWRGYGQTVRLIEVVRPDEKNPAHNDMPFLASRFRPIVSRKTDISALKALLVPGAKIRETA